MSEWLTIVQVHFDKTEENNHNFESSAGARKLMHRFTQDEVEKAMEDTMKAEK